MTDLRFEILPLLTLIQFLERVPELGKGLFHTGLSFDTHPLCDQAGYGETHGDPVIIMGVN